MKIVVLGGGLSTERQVSLVSAASICRALRSLGHQAVFVDLYFGLEDYEGPLEKAFDEPDGLCTQAVIGHEMPDLRAVRALRRDQGPSRIGKGVLELCAMADCVFLGLHGADGEDGKIQATLELMGIPYTGSGPLGSAMAMDKAVAKRMMETAGVLTPAWRELRYTEADIPRLCRELPVPSALKVVGGGSSIGVVLPERREELEGALHELLRYGNRIIVEEKMRGREITVPVLDGRALCPIEIVPPEGMRFDYVSKYQSGDEGAREICPAPLSDSDWTAVCAAARKVHEALKLSVYSRSDFILDDRGRPWCLEVNTLPGMTPNSLIPKAAAVEGMSYAELCEKIVTLSVKEKRGI